MWGKFLIKTDGEVEYQEQVEDSLIATWRKTYISDRSWEIFVSSEITFGLRVKEGDRTTTGIAAVVCVRLLDADT